MTVFFKFAVFLISLFLLTAISGCNQAEEAKQEVGIGIETGNGEEPNNGDEKEDGYSDQKEDNDDR